VEARVYTGCPQKFEVAGIKASGDWVRFVASDSKAPLTLRLEVNVDGLAAGVYEVLVTVVIPDAYRPVVEIPVRLLISGPAAEEEDGQTEASETENY
jgi:hypothetical protein